MRYVLKKFYVYVWKDLDDGNIFYVGKGCGKRYKSLRNRNKYFMEYVSSHNVDSEIVAYFDTEDEAFKYEESLMKHYKDMGQCKCSLMSGGYGGFSSVWSDEMKHYWSEYNPMKSPEQRERMSKSNPMRNADVAQRNGAKHQKAVIINGIEYSGLKVASKQLGVAERTVLVWCKRGYDTDGNPCRYANKPQKDYKFSKTSSKAILVDGKHLFNSLKEATQFFGVKDTSPLCRSLKENKPYHGHIVEYANQQPS